MARLARAVIPGIPHHITQRGNHRERTFFNEGDCARYLELIAESCETYDVEVWAWCLMPNHSHLITVPSTEDGLRFAMGEAHGQYSLEVNRRMGRQGHLWQGRFFSHPMDERYTLSAARYIELNPVRAGLVLRPEDWRWSSARAHLAGEDDRLVRVRPLLTRVPDWAAFIGAGLEDQTLAELRKHISTGRPLGSDDFIQEMELRLGRPLRPGKPGRPPLQTSAYPTKICRVSPN